MLPKDVQERKNLTQSRPGNEAVVLLSSASGRTVGFIVGIGRRSIPFGSPPAEKHSDRGNILDALMDGSFLPSDTSAYSEIDDMQFDDTVYGLGSRLRRSLLAKDLSGRCLSEIDYLMQHINMTEN
ncbi:MAG: hypothetical protein AB1427_03560 [Thermodesulfobacteriota bacterium]